MCGPALVAAIPYITLALSAAGTGVAINESNDAAKRQSKLLQAQTDAANTEAGIQASQEAGSRVSEARAEASRRLVAAGEAGVGGNSADAAINDPLATANQDGGTLASNALYSGVNTTLRAQSEALSIRRTGGASAGLQIATSGAGGYFSGLQSQNNLRKG
jgi:hypothetical protein